ncbi:hypothetical protein ACFU96_21395 [Streptomyces sp. NPDC057620]|uniref:hypothetical protein n=1 Tax=Streptomyces sp. NPDC057620 TaxID=3346185 RepID=UPI0036935542
MSVVVPVRETAGQQMTRTLATSGITAHTDADAGNSWLAINLGGADFPGVGVPQLVAYLYDTREDWLFVKEPVGSFPGTWRVAYDDGTRSRILFYGSASAMKATATETAECVAFITNFYKEHTTVPVVVSGNVLVDALAKHGISPVRDILSYAVPVKAEDPAKGGDDWSIYVADHQPSIDHPAAEHTGWDVCLCDGNGEPVRSLYDGIRRDGSLADCERDSSLAAAAIAEYLSTHRA